MKNHVYSWYLGTSTPKKLLIGPKGHDCADWRELEPVAMPREWWVNGFYMEAEARLVMNKHDLERLCDSKAQEEPNQIRYQNINYQIPSSV